MWEVLCWDRTGMLLNKWFDPSPPCLKGKLDNLLYWLSLECHLKTRHCLHVFTLLSCTINLIMCVIFSHDQVQLIHLRALKTLHNCVQNVPCMQFVYALLLLFVYFSQQFCCADTYGFTYFRNATSGTLLTSES